MALRHTNELKIPEKVLTLCSKSDPIEIRLVKSMIWQVIWEIPILGLPCHPLVMASNG